MPEGSIPAEGVPSRRPGGSAVPSSACQRGRRTPPMTSRSSRLPCGARQYAPATPWSLSLVRRESDVLTAVVSTHRTKERFSVFRVLQLAARNFYSARRMHSISGSVWGSFSSWAGPDGREKPDRMRDALFRHLILRQIVADARRECNGQSRVVATTNAERIAALSLRATDGSAAISL